MLSYIHGQIGKQMKRDSSQQKVGGNTDQDKDGERGGHILHTLVKNIVLLWLKAVESVLINDRHEVYWIGL